MSSVEYGVYRKWFDRIIKEEKPHLDLIGEEISSVFQLVLCLSIIKYDLLKKIMNVPTMLKWSLI